VNSETKRFDNALAKGTRLENYILGDVLGAGVFGITYRAEDVDLRTSVAIKEYLPCDLASRGDETAMIVLRSAEIEPEYQYGLDGFLAEAQTLAMFRHSNIVSVKRFFKANNSAYLVMDYEEGQSLSRYLATHPNPDEKTLKKIFVPILLGLSLIHEHGYLHRDINPDNIYLRENGFPLLIDFGATRYAFGDHSDLITSSVPTGYYSFERRSGEGKQGPYTDLYAIGATLYKCTTGKVPIDVSLRVDAQTQGKPDPLVSASEFSQGQYSLEFLEVIDQLINPDVQSRPQTVDAVLDKLRSGLRESDYTPKVDPKKQEQNINQATLVMSEVSTVQTMRNTEDFEGSNEDTLLVENESADKNKPEVADCGVESEVESGPPVANLFADKSINDYKASSLDGNIDSVQPVQRAGQPVHMKSGFAEAQTVRLVEGGNEFDTGIQLSEDNRTRAAEVESETVYPLQKRTLVIIDVIALIIGVAVFGGGWFWLITPSDFSSDKSSAMNASLQSARILIEDKDYTKTKSMLDEQLGDNPNEPEIKNLLTEIEKNEKVEILENDSFTGIFQNSAARESEGQLISELVPELVSVRGGCFEMGASLGENGRDADERLHQVCVSDFSIGKYEVTFAEYDRFANSTGIVKPLDEGWGRGRRPVIHVNAREAEAFTQWLSVRTGQYYRLPTEAEWEYACRSGDQQQIYCGGNSADTVAWYIGNSAYQTQLVGKKKPNLLGLYDMSGNVWEWTCSFYSVDYDGSETRCGNGSGRRVLRGGSWGNESKGVRAANRPRFDAPIYLLNFIGFRVVRE